MYVWYQLRYNKYCPYVLVDTNRRLEREVVARPTFIVLPAAAFIVPTHQYVRYFFAYRRRLSDSLLQEAMVTTLYK